MNTIQYPLFFIQRFKGKVLFDVSLSEHTSIRIGGNADVMAFPQDENDLKDIIGFAETKKFPFYVMGAGTNLLVRDGGVRGIVVNLSEGFKDMEWQASGRLASGAGVMLPELAARCAEKGLSGLEFACGIPGTVGGAVAMNAGAYGAEMKDIVEGVEIVTKKAQLQYIPKSEIRFSYRFADLPKGSIVVKAHIALKKGEPQEIRERVRQNKEKRKSTAHIVYPNAGSIFRNPEGHIAGRLIEEAGLKGLKAGDAMISEVHANYIVNTGRAMARDVLSLMAIIRDKVYKEKGIVLEPEIKVIGEDLPF
jgi:UDP-N-acetylmuramate dehydrogenase